MSSWYCVKFWNTIVPCLYIYFKHKTAVFVKGKQSRYYCVGIYEVLTKILCLCVYICHISCFDPEVVRITHFAVGHITFHAFFHGDGLKNKERNDYYWMLSGFLFVHFDDNYLVLKLSWVLLRRSVSLILSSESDHIYIFIYFFLLPNI